MTTVQAFDVEAPVDYLAGICAVLGDDARVRTQEVLHRLRTRNDAVCTEWTFSDLKAELEPYEGAEPYESDGVMGGRPGPGGKRDPGAARRDERCF